MATRTFEFPCFSGQTVTLKLYTENTDTQVFSASATERTNKKGFYTVSVVDIASGAYDWRAHTASGSTLIVGKLDHVNAAGTEVPRGSALEQGIGPYVITITIVDPSDVPVQNARVSLSRTGESYQALTNASGVAVFGVESGSWTVAVSATGFTFTPVSLTVLASASQEYEISVSTPPGSTDPTLAVGYLYAYGVDGQIEADIDFTCYLFDGPGTTGRSLDTTQFTLTSDDNGLVSYNGFIRGASYRIKRGRGQYLEFTVPNSDLFNIAELLGSP